MPAIECQDACDCHGGTTSDGREMRFVARTSCPACGEQVVVAEDVTDAARRGVLHVDPLCQWFTDRMSQLDKLADVAARRAWLDALETEVMAPTRSN